MKNAKTVLTLAAFVAAATMIARAQTSVFVPGNTNGGFGNPIDIVVPLVPAITVSGPSRITVTYVSGTVTVVAGVDTGPNGTKWNFNVAQSPLQEARGASGGADRLGALIGVFVPASSTGTLEVPASRWHQGSGKKWDRTQHARVCRYRQDILCARSRNSIPRHQR